MFSSRANRFVAVESLLVALLMLHSGTSGLSIVSGAGGEVFSDEPASHRLARQRQLLWLGFGGGEEKKDGQENQNEAGDKHEGKTEDVREVDGEGRGVDGEGRGVDGEGNSHEEALGHEGLDDADHIWHDGDHEEHHGDTEGEDGAHDTEDSSEEDDDNADDNDDDDDDDDGIIYTHGNMLTVAKNLLSEYQLKSLNIKEELTDDEGREREAERLEADIDTEIDLLMKRAGERDAALTAQDDGVQGNVKKREFLEKMVGARKAAKKRVKDILTGHNVHFDKDNL